MEEVRNEPHATGEAFAAFHRLRHWRTRHWLLFTVPVFGSLIVAYLHFTSPPPNLSVESYERIREGMTEAEVEDIIGARPGGYGLFWGPGELRKEEWGTPVRAIRWTDEFGYLTVGLDVNGRVCKKVYEFAPQRPSAPRPRGSWWEELSWRSIPREPGVCYISF